MQDIIIVKQKIEFFAIIFGKHMMIVFGILIAILSLYKIKIFHNYNILMKDILASSSSDGKIKLWKTINDNHDFEINPIEPSTYL